MRMARALLAAAASLWSVAAAGALPLQQRGGSAAILMQGFHWNSAAAVAPDWYGVLAGRAGDMAALGVTHVWFPPPSDSLSRQGYLPRQLNLLASAYGTQAELQAALAAMRAAGLRAVADVVVNHRVGTSNASRFTNPAWTTASIARDDECGCGAGQPDTGWGYAAARDLDHTDPQVKAGIPALLGRLKALGFSGLRYDYALGYSAGLQAAYTAGFAPDFCVDEIWSTLDLAQVAAHRRTELDYATAAGCGAFDFTTHGLLVEALSHGDYDVLRDAASGGPAGLLGVAPARAVTFVDNHDTGPAETCRSGQNQWPTPCGAVMQAYAYILSHPGIPTLFWPHVYDWGLRAPILALAKARRDAGVTSTSPVAIQRAESRLYAAIISGGARALAVKIGPASWSPGAGWALQASGANYAVWLK